MQNWIEIRGRWTSTGAILSLVSGFESNGVDVDSAMVNDGGSMPMRIVRWMVRCLCGVVWCGVDGVFGMTGVCSVVCR